MTKRKSEFSDAHPLMNYQIVALSKSHRLDGISKIAKPLEIFWAPLVEGVAGLKEVSVALLEKAQRSGLLTAIGAWRKKFVKELNSEVYFSGQIGCSLQFRVNGNAFGIYCHRHDYSGVIAIDIDDRVVAEINLFSIWNEHNPTLLVVQGMDEGEHIIKLTISGRSETALGSELYLRSLFLPRNFVEQIEAPAATFEAAPLSRMVSFHSRGDSNVGDRTSPPHLYFSFLNKTRSHDLYDWHPFNQRSYAERVKVNAALEVGNVIIGGGGLLCSNWFSPALEYISRSAVKKAVIWGAGHNSLDRSHWRADYDHYNISASSFGPIGVRDYGVRFPWVPCASCMSEVFDEFADPTRELGFFLHANESAAIETMRRSHPHVPIRTNFCSFDEAIQFIRSCETIVTNSFHGTYWATLLKRKVVAIPTSSKFFSLKHGAPKVELPDWRSALARTFIHDNALEECRASNRRFADEVYAYFSEPL